MEQYTRKTVQLAIVNARIQQNADRLTKKEINTFQFQFIFEGLRNQLFAIRERMNLKEILAAKELENCSEQELRNLI